MSMEFLHRFISLQHRQRRIFTAVEAAGTKRLLKAVPKRCVINTYRKSPEPLKDLLLHWTLKRLSADFLLQRLTFRRSGILQLSRLCTQFASGSFAVVMKQKCAPSTWVAPSQKHSAKFPVGRLIESWYAGAPYKATTGTHDILVYLKCRGSVDPIRLLLRHKNIPHLEFHVDRSFQCQEISKQFEAAGLPATLPYYSDIHCEMTGPRTILNYLAGKTGLGGTTKEQSVRIESIADFCFAALNALWRADCTCTYPRELNRERARAHYCRDKILPILQTLCALVSPDISREDDNTINGWEFNRRQPYHQTKQSRWIIGEFSVADILVYSTLSSLTRQVRYISECRHIDSLLREENSGILPYSLLRHCVALWNALNQAAGASKLSATRRRVFEECCLQPDVKAGLKNPIYSQLHNEAKSKLLFHVSLP